MWLFGSVLVGATVLALLGALHAYWALGGRFGKGAVIPERNGVPLFKPGVAATLVVAVLLWAGAACLLMRLGFFGEVLPAGISTGAAWVMALVFLLRAIGDFRYVGFTKRVARSRFAYWDTRLYSPLCLLIAASCVSAVLYTPR
jgi:hypothetical protein